MAHGQMAPMGNVNAGVEFCLRYIREIGVIRG